MKVFNIYGQEVASLVDDLERRSALDLCLAFLRAKPWINSIVAGFDSVEQLRETAKAINHPPLAPDAVELVEKTFPDTTVDLLNPANWPK